MGVQLLQWVSKAYQCIVYGFTFCFYIPIKILRNYAFSSGGNDAINIIPQICIENIHMISPPFFASFFYTSIACNSIIVCTEAILF